VRDTTAQEKLDEGSSSERGGRGGGRDFTITIVSSKGGVKHLWLGSEASADHRRKKNGRRKGDPFPMKKEGDHIKGRTGRQGGRSKKRDTTWQEREKEGTACHRQRSQKECVCAQRPRASLYREKETLDPEQTKHSSHFNRRAEKC